MRYNRNENIEKRMNDYEKLIEDLKSQKEQLERERGNQFTENDILEFVADLLQGDPADKDYQKKLIDNLVVKVFVGDGYITAHIKLGNATEVADIRLEEVKKALEHIFNSVQTLSPLAQREGFEPSVPLRGTHDFQSCSLGRSDISAWVYSLPRGASAREVSII